MRTHTYIHAQAFGIHDLKLYGIQMRMPILAASLIRSVCGLLASTTTDVRQTCEKRPILPTIPQSINRDLYRLKDLQETCTQVRQTCPTRPLSIKPSKRDLYQSTDQEEIYINQTIKKRPISIKRDLKKRPTGNSELFGDAKVIFTLWKCKYQMQMHAQERAVSLGTHVCEREGYFPGTCVPEAQGTYTK